MKHLHTIEATLCLIAVAALLLNGCANIFKGTREEVGKEKLIHYIDNNQEIKKLLLNPEDREDEKINTYLYYLGLSLQGLVRNPTFNQVVISLAQRSTNQTANLLELKPEFQEAINRYLQSNFNLTLDRIAKDLTHKGEMYVPCIFIPNLENIDYSIQPVLSPNIEVDCSKNEKLEDNIIAWLYTKSGKIKEIIIGENNVIRTSVPIFLMDNGEANPKQYNFKTYPPDSNPTPSAAKTTYFHSNEYKINWRFEGGSNKSEFTIVAYRIDPTGTVHWIYNSSGWQQIAKVHKDDIGKYLSKWILFARNYTPYNTNYVFWNTYERDWNRSDKSLGQASANGKTIYLSGRRKYSGDWYNWDPSNLQASRPDFNFIYWNWAKWFIHSNGELRVWRVEL